jgi:single-strand DNA-binding protein
MKKGLNHWTVMGNVGKDPEMRSTGAGVPVCNFSIAVNSSWKNTAGEVTEHVEWVYVVCWRKLAEIAAEFVKKGNPVLVEGRAQTSSYEKDGVTKYKTELVCDNLILLGGKRDGAPAEQSDVEYTGPTTSKVDPDLPF